MSSRMLDLNLERDIPTTPADVEALERARDLRPLPTQAYLDWLTLMSVPRLPRETNSDSDEPFVL